MIRTSSPLVRFRFRWLLIALALLPLSCSQNVNGNDPIEVQHLLNKQWRHSRIETARIQSAAIRHLALTVTREHNANNTYDPCIYDWLDEIQSKDVRRIVRALERPPNDQQTKIPVELLIGVVSPLLSERRGYTEVRRDTPMPGAFCGTPWTRVGDISLAAATLLKKNAAANPDLTPVLAVYAVEARDPPCRTLGAVLNAMVYSATDPKDVELAATVLLELASRSPWNTVPHPWEEHPREERCNPMRLTKQCFRTLRHRHRDIPWLQNGHLIVVSEGIP